MSSFFSYHPVTLQCSLSQYCRLWFKSVVLSILSLGWYGPWAQQAVGSFWGQCLVLQGVSFRYKISLNMLMCRQSVLLILACLVLISALNASGWTILWLAAALLAWPLLRGIGWCYRMQAWRYQRTGLRCSGSWHECFLLFLSTYLNVFSIGLLCFLVEYFRQKTLMSRVRFFSHHFQSMTPLPMLWRAWLYAWGLGWGLFLVSLMMGLIWHRLSQGQWQPPTALWLGCAVFAGGMFYICWRVLSLKLFYTHLYLGSLGHTQCKMPVAQGMLYYGLRLWGSVFSLGLAWPWLNWYWQQFFWRHILVGVSPDLQMVLDQCSGQTLEPERMVPSVFIRPVKNSWFGRVSSVFSTAPHMPLKTVKPAHSVPVSAFYESMLEPLGDDLLEQTLLDVEPSIEDETVKPHSKDQLSTIEKAVQRTSLSF